MTKTRKPRRSQADAAASGRTSNAREKAARGSSARPAWLDAALGTAFTAAIVASTCSPTEQSAESGAGLPLVMLWLLLGVAWSLAACRWPTPWRATLSLAAAACFLTWAGGSTLASLGRENARAALNGFWNFAAYAAIFLLTLNLWTTDVRRRALLALLIGLGAAEAAMGHFQFFYAAPRRAAEYFEADARQKSLILQEVGVQDEPGRVQFENRLRSTEPNASFVLANSLAGLLAMACAVALGVVLGSSAGIRRPILLPYALYVLLAVMGLCLLLTKSRSAWLGLGAGVVMLLWWQRRRAPWKSIGIGAAAIALLAGVGWGVGALDREVLTEAGKSLGYRMQYWKGAVQIANEHPMWGCGPGNFQNHYPQFKSPEASETILDPHNFMLETAATLGWPAAAILAAFLLLITRECWRSCSATPARNDSTAAQGEGFRGQASDEGRRWLGATAIGAVLGLLLAWPLSILMQAPLEWLSDSAAVPLVWMVGGPIVLGTLWFLRGWVEQGGPPQSFAALGLLVLLVNLTAAGGWTYLAVGQWVWLLAAVAVSGLRDRGAKESSSEGAWNPAGNRKPPWPHVIVAVASVVALVLFQWTAFQPHWQAASRVVGAERLSLDAALQAYREGAALDPWSANMARNQMQLQFRRWTIAPSDEAWAEFLAAADEALRRDPHSHLLHSELGDLMLAAWRATGEANQLQAALSHDRMAAELYPNYARKRAQWAWAAHLAGEDSQAAELAEQALQLDAANPHVEHKLRRQRITDPGAPELLRQTAEQVMQSLRKEGTSQSGGSAK